MLVFFFTVIIFRCLVWCVVYGGFVLFKKDYEGNMFPNMIVSFITAGALGFLTFIILADDVCHIIRYDTVSNFMFTSKKLLFGSAVGSFWLFILYAGIAIPYVLIKDKVKKLYNIKDMDLFMALSMHTLASATAVALLFSYFTCT